MNKKMLVVWRHSQIEFCPLFLFHFLDLCSKTIFFLWIEFFLQNSGSFTSQLGVLLQKIWVGDGL